MTAPVPKTIVEAEGMVPESWWLTSTPAPPLRPTLQGTVAADVVLVGGGFTGLWTAYELLRRNPKLRLVVLERDRVGSGASGRNGGWCVPELNISPARLAERFGSAAARRLRVAMKDTVGHISAVLREESIDADFERSGVLLVARGRGQLSPLAAMAAEFRDAGWGDDYQRLGSKECQQLVEISQVEGGLFSECGASVHPGKLVRGLALAVERRGGVIYERSTVDRIVSGPSPLVATSTGEVRAAVVVLGLEAYLSQLARFHRRVLPLYSLIVLTEPLSPSQLEEVGWRRRVLVSSMRLSVDYLNRTVDGRVLVGGEGPVQLRLGHPSLERAPRCDARKTAPTVSRLVSTPVKGRLHPRLGRGPGDATRLDASGRLRSRSGAGLGLRLHGTRSGHLQSGWNGSGGLDHRNQLRADLLAPGGSSLAELGGGAVSVARSAVRPSWVGSCGRQSRGHRDPAHRSNDCGADWGPLS